jgi:hypothetical protein
MANVSSLERARIGFYMLWNWEVLKAHVIGCALNQLWIWGATKWHAWEPSQSLTWWGSWISCVWWTCVAIRTRICWESWRAGSIILLSLPSRLADSTSSYWVYLLLLLRWNITWLFSTAIGIELHSTKSSLSTRIRVYFFIFLHCHFVLSDEKNNRKPILPRRFPNFVSSHCYLPYHECSLWAWIHTPEPCIMSSRS